MINLEEKPKNRLASEYIDKEIDELISKLRKCEACSSAYFEGTECRYCIIHKNINHGIDEVMLIGDYCDVHIEGVARYKPKPFRKPISHYCFHKKKFCEICGKEFYSSKLVCSILCRIRSYSIVYSKNGLTIGMSLEEGIKKYEKITGRKYIYEEDKYR